MTIYDCLHMMDRHKQLERNVVSSYVCHRRDEGGTREGRGRDEGGTRDDGWEKEKLVDSCNAVLGRRSWNHNLQIYHILWSLKDKLIHNVNV